MGLLFFFGPVLVTAFKQATGIDNIF
jgi:hypothetical protein